MHGMDGKDCVGKSRSWAAHKGQTVPFLREYTYAVQKTKNISALVWLECLPSAHSVILSIESV